MDNNAKKSGSTALLLLKFSGLIFTEHSPAFVSPGRRLGNGEKAAAFFFDRKSGCVELLLGFYIVERNFICHAFPPVHFHHFPLEEKMNEARPALGGAAC